jgi:hypothetical protein
VWPDAVVDTPQGAFLLGTTSRAAVPAQNVCGDGGIYVRADAIVDWIEAVPGVNYSSPWRQLELPT